MIVKILLIKAKLFTFSRLAIANASILSNVEWTSCTLLHLFISNSVNVSQYSQTFIGFIL